MVSVDGTPTDVTFTEDEDRFLGLVEGLPEGDATIEVAIGDDRVELDVTNHPITGPVFSGPHVPMPVCTTERNGLGPPLDDDCSIAHKS